MLTKSIDGTTYLTGNEPPLFVCHYGAVVATIGRCMAALVAGMLAMFLARHVVLLMQRPNAAARERRPACPYMTLSTHKGKQ